MRFLTAAAVVAAVVTSPATAQAHPTGPHGLPGYPAPSMRAAHVVPHNHHKLPALWGTRHQYHRYHKWSVRRGWAPVAYGWSAERSHDPNYWLWTYRLWWHRATWAKKHALHYEAKLRAQENANPVALGRALAAQRGWTGANWIALYSLWNRESGWNPGAYNASSGACGIPQALPCSKIPDHSTRGQIEWGLGYIAADYGSPSAAWAHSEAYGWY